MKLSNVRLILGREIRDQLRDRRTLFLIAVLPLALYPLLGISLMQATQFIQERPTRVLVVGAERLACEPPLFDGNRFADASGGARLLELHFVPPDHAGDADESARAAVKRNEFEAALVFPPDFADRLDEFRASLRRGTVRPWNASEGVSVEEDPGRVRACTHHEDFAAKSGACEHAPYGLDTYGNRNEGVEGSRLLQPKVPSPEIFHNTASEKSMVTFARLSEALSRWTQRIGDETLSASGLSAAAMRPFLVETSDVAESPRRAGAAWSKLLPVLLLLWALTGAFYPAIDLCAGEKERGTMETLLTSPAERSEIVMGKLLTVMLFSIATAVLNLASMALTSCLVLARMPGFGLPSPGAVVALAIALVPVAALFSALCLGLAAFARSTKEGQYYLMPLLLVSMPLVVLPMSPGVELNLGNSLIPLTGIVLVLRSVMEGDYRQALQYAPVVTAVTAAAAAMAVRWTIEQFHSESVLFRESERLALGCRLRRMLRERRATPTVAAASVCAVAILVVQFFLSATRSAPGDFAGFARSLLTSQLGVILAPALLMTFLLTSRPRRTLLLARPRWTAVPAAAALALALHPAAVALRGLVARLYPVGEDYLPTLAKMSEMLQTADFWTLLLLVAALPAVCEELAFRGFILSGFRSLGGKWRAIFASAIFFGLTHGILQQSLLASLLGVVLAYLAIQTGSILPGMVFHLCHNALAVANTRVVAEMVPSWPVLRAFVAPVAEGGCEFTAPAVVAGAMIAFLLLSWFRRLDAQPLSGSPLLEKPHFTEKPSGAWTYSVPTR